MARAATIENVKAKPGAEAIRLSWDWRGRGSRVVRALRSAEWYPETPHDAQTRAFDAALAYEGDASGFADVALRPGAEYFYALFTREKDGWSRPVHVHVWTIADGHAAEVYGDRAAAAPVRDPVALDTALLLPFACVAATVLALVSGSVVSHGVSVAAAIALTAVWRRREEPDAPVSTFLRWQIVPLAVTVILWSFGGILGLFTQDSSLLGKTAAAFLRTFVTLGGLSGVWLYTTYTFIEPLRSDERRRALLLWAPPLVALALPDVVLLAAAIVAVLLWSMLSRERARQSWRRRKRVPYEFKGLTDEEVEALTGVARPRPAAEAAGAGPGEARMLTRDGDRLFSFACPVHGTAHVEPYDEKLVRRYRIARDEGDCLCPATTPWHLRLGLTRTQALLYLLVGLWALNVADLLFTWNAIAAGKATEANGLMQRLIDAGPGPAIAFKIGVMTVAVIAIWALRRHRAAFVVTAAATAAYAAIVVWETLWAVGYLVS